MADFPRRVRGAVEVHAGRTCQGVTENVRRAAAHHGLTVLHDDADYGTVVRHASDLTEHTIQDVV